MPNVLILMSDEHNPFYSSVYGHEKVKTPNMERLAALGTVYEHAYCPSPLCLPSRSAFLAGKPVHQLQTYNNCNVFTFDYPSYGGVLASQGVHTVYMGKMDAYNQPETMGFSELIHAQGRKPPGDTNIARTPLAIRADAGKRANGYGPKADAGKGDLRVISAAEEWLTHTAPALQQPWTLTVNLGTPHFPHFAPPEVWDMYQGQVNMPTFGPECPPGQHPYAHDLRNHFQTVGFTPQQVMGLRQGYYAGVTQVDAWLGRLISCLEAGGLLADTIVAYTADHGEMLGKFGMWWKCSLYEDSVRIPRIVAGPGFTPGRRVQTPVSLLDLQAAIFRALDKQRPADWWGAPLQDIPEADPSRAVFSEYHGHGTRSGAFLIRQGPWKLIYNMAAPHQLFNLERDPHEQENLADRETGIFRLLAAELHRLCSPDEENRQAHEWEERQMQALAELHSAKAQ